MGGNCEISVTVFIVFHFYLILTDLSAMLVVDSAPPPSVLLILLLNISFSLLSFCTWFWFFSVLTRRAFLKVVCKSSSILFSVSQIDCQLGLQFCKVFIGDERG